MCRSSMPREAAHVGRQRYHEPPFRDLDRPREDRDSDARRGRRRECEHVLERIHERDRRPRSAESSPPRRRERSRSPRRRSRSPGAGKEHNRQRTGRRSRSRSPVRAVRRRQVVSPVRRRQRSPPARSPNLASQYDDLFAGAEWYSGVEPVLEDPAASGATAASTDGADARAPPGAHTVSGVPGRGYSGVEALPTQSGGVGAAAVAAAADEPPASPRTVDAHKLSLLSSFLSQVASVEPQGAVAALAAENKSTSVAAATAAQNKRMDATAAPARSVGAEARAGAPAAPAGTSPAAGVAGTAAVASGAASAFEQRAPWAQGGQAVAAEAAGAAVGMGTAGVAEDAQAAAAAAGLKGPVAAWARRSALGEESIAPSGAAAAAGAGARLRSSRHGIESRDTLCEAPGDGRPPMTHGGDSVLCGGGSSVHGGGAVIHGSARGGVSSHHPPEASAPGSCATFLSATAAHQTIEPGHSARDGEAVGGTERERPALRRWRCGAALGSRRGFGNRHRPVLLKWEMVARSCPVLSRAHI